MADLSISTIQGPYLTEGASLTSVLNITLETTTATSYTFTPTPNCMLVVINTTAGAKVLTLTSEASTLNGRKYDVVYTIGASEVLSIFKFTKTDGWVNATTGKISFTTEASLKVALVRI